MVPFNGGDWKSSPINSFAECEVELRILDLVAKYSDEVLTFYVLSEKKSWFGKKFMQVPMQFWKSSSDQAWLLSMMQEPCPGMLACG